MPNSQGLWDRLRKTSARLVPVRTSESGSQISTESDSPQQDTQDSGYASLASSKSEADCFVPCDAAGSSPSPPVCDAADSSASTTPRPGSPRTRSVESSDSPKIETDQGDSSCDVVYQSESPSAPDTASARATSCDQEPEGPQPTAATSRRT
jgi:hypothetical protein